MSNAIAKVLGTVIRVLRTPLKLWTQQQKLVALVAALSVVFTGVATTTVVLHATQETPAETTPPTIQTTAPVETTTAPTTEATTEPTTEATTEPTEPEPIITDKVLELREMKEENPHVTGWIYLPNTTVNEVVMYSPDKPDFYLYHKPTGQFSAGGTVYIDEVCSAVEPETQVLQLYGHNMLSGAHFAGIFVYEKQKFADANPYIYYTTTEGARCYQVVTAGYDVYVEDKSDEEKVYFDKFVAPATEEEFNKYMDHFYENSKIDTGVTVTYDDNIIMLITCAYHVADGRFIILAKEVPYVEP